MWDDEFLDKLDDGPLLGFDDGVFDFRSMTFRVGRPDDFVSLSVGYKFPHLSSGGGGGAPPHNDDNNRSSNNLENAIQEVMRVIGDPFESIEMADYLLKTLASSLDGRRSVAEFYVWTGAGSNGKSTIQELIMSALGKYAQPLDVTFWTRPRGSSGSALPELADKRACRYVFSNEPEACDKLQIAKLKEATGGERLTARRLYGDPISYRPKFGIFILANTLPELSRMDGGISRRLRVLPFTRQFKQYPLPGELLAQPSVMENCRTNIKWRQALMFLLIQKYGELKSSSSSSTALTAIPLPTEVQNASAEYLEDNNPVGRFLADCFTITGDETDFIRASELLRLYLDVTRDRSMTVTAFGTSMTHTNGVPKKKKKVEGVAAWYYIGLRRKNNDLGPPDAIV
jgi:P4 family phage/plasmid primase-like protien